MPIHIHTQHTYLPPSHLYTHTYTHAHTNIHTAYTHNTLTYTYTHLHTYMPIHFYTPWHLSVAWGFPSHHHRDDKHTLPHPLFNCGLWESDSDPYACLTSILPSACYLPSSVDILNILEERSPICLKLDEHPEGLSRMTTQNPNISQANTFHPASHRAWEHLASCHLETQRRPIFNLTSLHCSLQPR